METCKEKVTWRVVISTIVSLSTHSVNHNQKQLIFKIIICIYCIYHTPYSSFPRQYTKWSLYNVEDLWECHIDKWIHGSSAVFFFPFRFTKFGIFLPYIFRFDGDKKIHRATHTSMRWGLPLTTTRCIHSARCALFTNLFICTHQAGFNFCMLTLKMSKSLLRRLPAMSFGCCQVIIWGAAELMPYNVLSTDSFQRGDFF